MKRKEFIYGLFTQSILHVAKDLTECEDSFPFETALKAQYPFKLCEVTSHKTKIIYVKVLGKILTEEELVLASLLNELTTYVFIKAEDRSDRSNFIKHNMVLTIINQTLNVDKEFSEYFMSYLEKREIITVRKRDKLIAINRGKLV